MIHLMLKVNKNMIQCQKYQRSIFSVRCSILHRLFGLNCGIIEENCIIIILSQQTNSMEESFFKPTLLQNYASIKRSVKKNHESLDKTLSQCPSDISIENVSKYTQNKKNRETHDNRNRNRKKNIIMPSTHLKSIDNSTQLSESKKQCQSLQSSIVYSSHQQKYKSLNIFYNRAISDSQNKAYIKNIVEAVVYCKKNMKILLDSQHVDSYAKRLAQPQQNSQKKMLFLDLDQTLVKTQQQTDNKQKNTFKISIRPYTSYFLEYLSQFYNIYAFTAATKSYAEAVIGKLNRKNGKPHVFILDYFCRSQCLELKKRGYIKDLRIVKNRELKDIVIIDNLVESFGMQLNNGIPISDFEGREDDDQLFKLIPFLEKLSKVKDVRPVLKKRYNLESLSQFSSKDIKRFIQLRSCP